MFNRRNRYPYTMKKKSDGWVVYRNRRRVSAYPVSRESALQAVDVLNMKWLTEKRDGDPRLFRVRLADAQRTYKSQG